MAKNPELMASVKEQEDQIQCVKLLQKTDNENRFCAKERKVFKQMKDGKIVERTQG